MSRTLTLITGLGVAATGRDVRTLRGQFAPGECIEIIRDGFQGVSTALFEMDIGGGVAAHLVSRLDHCRHDGALVGTRPLIH